jgi:hypothetical protein
VDIHQASVSYNTNADRLLLRVRTRDDQLFQAWLTRRLMLRLWSPLGGIVTKLHLATATPHAVVVPEARAMVAQAARTQSLQGADFKTPFVATVREQPLGEEPMLVAEVQLTQLPANQLKLVLLDDKRRHMTLQLTPQLVTGLQQLLGQALKQADWGILQDEPAPAGEPDQAETRLLN